MFFIVFLVFVSLAEAAIFADGPCPVVKPVPNINLTAFGTSTWYEAARYPNDMESHGDCPSITYTKENGKVKFQYKDVAFKNSVDDVFNGYLVSNPKTGAADFESLDFQEGEHTKLLTIYFMSVDYNNYVVLFDCTYDEKINKRHEYVWVLIRTKEITKEAKTAVDAYIKSSSIIDANKLVWNHFDDQSCNGKA